MGVLTGEADDLVFDRGAVAWAGGGDGAVEHRRPMKVVTDQRVGLRRGLDLVAGHLGAPAARWDVRIDGVRRRLVPLGSGRRIEAEPQRLLAAMLYARAGVIDAVGGQSRRRAGLEATQFQAGVSQVVGQRGGGRFAATTAGRHRIAHDDPAVQERSGGDHGGVGANLLAGAGADAAHAPGGRPVQRFRLPDEAVHMGLEERQVLLRLEQAAHEHAVGMLVALGAQGADGRSLCWCSTRGSGSGCGRCCGPFRRRARRSHVRGCPWRGRRSMGCRAFGRRCRGWCSGAPCADPCAPRPGPPRSRRGRRRLPGHRRRRCSCGCVGDAWTYLPTRR